MDSRYLTFALYGLAAIAFGTALLRLQSRLRLSRAKHRSLTGHSRMARRVASLVPFYEFDERTFFRVDNPPDEIAAQRRTGFMRLAQLYRERFVETRRVTAEIKDGVSDLQFTDTYRVPFQFSRLVREHLDAGSFLKSSAGVMLTDLDGNRLYDLTGSYGVNVFGHEFYKECMEQGYQRVRELGPVLGAYHPRGLSLQRHARIAGWSTLTLVKRSSRQRAGPQTRPCRHAVRVRNRPRTRSRCSRML